MLNIHLRLLFDVIGPEIARDIEVKLVIRDADIYQIKMVVHFEG